LICKHTKLGISAVCSNAFVAVSMKTTCHKHVNVIYRSRTEILSKILDRDNEM